MFDFSLDASVHESSGMEASNGSLAYSITQGATGRSGIRKSPVDKPAVTFSEIKEGLTFIAFSNMTKSMVLTLYSTKTVSI